jgi:hypothetical protein
MASSIKANSIQDKTGTRVLASDSGSAWSWGSGVPSGTVRQVLQSFKSDAESVAGSTGQNNFSFVPAQGGAVGSAFQQEITVTGSNKVLILHVGNYSLASANYQFYIGLFRGSAVDTAIGSCTKIAQGTEPSTNQTSASNNLLIPHASQALPLTTCFYDSPGAGTHFYKIGWGGESGGTILINRTGTNTDNGLFASLSSTLTLMEIQA